MLKENNPERMAGMPFWSGHLLIETLVTLGEILAVLTDTSRNLNFFPATATEEGHFVHVAYLQEFTSGVTLEPNEPFPVQIAGRHFVGHTIESIAR